MRWAARRYRSTGGVPPSTRYPAPMDDCYAGLAWTHQHAAELNVDQQRIAVGGASSGGGSAVGWCCSAESRGDYPVFFQLLIYPMLDDRNVTPASVSLTDPRVWNRTSNLIGWSAYVGDAAGATGSPPTPRPPGRPTWPDCRRPTWRSATWTCSSTRTSSTPSGCGRACLLSCTSTRAAATRRDVHAELGAGPAFYQGPRRSAGTGVRFVTGWLAVRGLCCRDGMIGARIWVMTSQVPRAKTIPPRTSVT